MTDGLTDPAARRAFLGAAAGAAGAFLLPRPARAAPADELRALADRAAILDLVSRIAFGADLREWDAVRACFADTVRVDYRSLTGEAPAAVPADALVGGWARTFSGFDVTQHLVTNHQVEVAGDAAVCRSHFLATHGIGPERWRLAGHYRHALARLPAGWRVTELTMTWTWEEGDRGLLARANTRAAG